MNNNNDKIRIKYPIVVEGRYDKSTILSVFDAKVLTTEGFGIFNSKEKQSLLKKLCERGGIILLTDSDAGGRQIRTFLGKILPKEKIFNLYIPEIRGKEPRKKTPSKAGLLGVEGVGKDALIRVLSPFKEDGTDSHSTPYDNDRVLTKMDLWEDGLSGGDGSSEKRSLLAKRFGFPSDISAKSLIEAINLTVGYSEYKNAVSELFGI